MFFIYLVFVFFNREYRLVSLVNSFLFYLRIYFNNFIIIIYDLIIFCINLILMYYEDILKICRVFKSKFINI